MNVEHEHTEYRQLHKKRIITSTAFLQQLYTKTEKPSTITIIYIHNLFREINSSHCSALNLYTYIRI